MAAVFSLHAHWATPYTQKQAAHATRGQASWNGDGLVKPHRLNSAPRPSLLSLATLRTPHWRWPRLPVHSTQYTPKTIGQPAIHSCMTSTARIHLPVTPPPRAPPPEVIPWAALSKPSNSNSSGDGHGCGETHFTAGAPHNNPHQYPAHGSTLHPPPPGRAQSCGLAQPHWAAGVWKWDLCDRYSTHAFAFAARA